MKNFRCTLIVCLCVSLLAISASALAAEPGCSGKKAAQAQAAEQTVDRQVAEEPAMAAIPPPQQEKSEEAARQPAMPMAKEDPAMAAIPGKGHQEESAQEN